MTDTYDDSAFGLENTSPDVGTSSTNAGGQKQIKKCVEKIRNNLRQLGLLVKVCDPPKMLNILVIGQQLNVIDPVEPLVEIVTPQTTQDILKVPTVTSRKRLRNKKLTFGFMSDIEIVNAVEDIVVADDSAEKQAEADKLSEIQMSNQIEILQSSIQDEQSNIQAKRDHLKTLKSQKAIEKKRLLKGKQLLVRKRKKIIPSS